MSQRVLFSAVKNEGPFLLEWVAYHRAIGFDRIVVVSNDSTDGTVELLDALHSHGIVEHIPQVVKAKTSPQNSAALIARERKILENGDWCLWLDADEFLNVHVGAGQVDDLVTAIGEKAGAVILCRIFGDGGNKLFPGRHISEDFVQCAASVRRGARLVKTLYRKDAKVPGFGYTSMHRPVIAQDSGLTLEDFIAPNGETLLNEERNLDWLKGAQKGGNAWCDQEEVGFALAQINHYSLRTPDMFVLKATRGRGARAVSEEPSERHTVDFYRTLNQSHATDRSILRHQSKLETETAALLKLPSVAKAQKRIDALRHEATAAILDLPAYKELLPYLQKKAGDDAAAANTSVDKVQEVEKVQITSAPTEVVLTLPAEEAACVKEVYAKSGTVLEFGSGGSTLLAAQKTGRKVFSVECDAKWAEMMEEKVRSQGAEAYTHIHYVDIGKTKAWSRPVNRDYLQNWPSYAISVWDRPDFIDPDVVLIDGRFRPACFLVTLMRIKKPTVILWDDYVERRQYHVAETLLKRSKTIGRMVQFDAVPGLFKPEHLALLAQKMLDPD